jgi:hypothetical protein
VTASWHYHAPDGTFRKVLPPDRARCEVAGWQAVASLLPVPRLREVREAADGCEVVYDDVFASGRSRGLLADSINAADRHPGQAAAVAALVDRVCDDLLTAAWATGKTSRLGDCVPDLYAARLTPGGRLDRWYTWPPLPAWPVCGQRLDLDDLARRTWVVQGRALGSGWPAALTGLRAALAGHTRWATAITQGDVTEPNITEPLCWLDFEHAGRNALAGDAANFLWYLLGMGGWLVPAYQPAVYARTLRTPVPPGSRARHRPPAHDSQVHRDRLHLAGTGRSARRAHRAAAPARWRPRDRPGPGRRRRRRTAALPYCADTLGHPPAAAQRAPRLSMPGQTH